MKKTLLLLILFITQVFYAQSDCITAIPLCGNSDISYTPSGHGNIQEELSQSGCLGRDENYSVWYTFTIATSGTLSFTIDPNVNTDDYDFAVYGPATNGCASLNTNNVFVTPIRCNYAGRVPNGDTGLSLTIPPPGAPNGTGTAGNQGEWSPYMDVIAGQTYYLIVDNFESSPDGFKLVWGGTATLSSAFNDPVLAPNPFIPPGIPGAAPTDPTKIMVCGLPSQFNFNTLTAGIINGNNPNFQVTYHDNTNDVVTGEDPLTIATVNATTDYYYRIRYLDPANPDNVINKCFISGKFKFVDASITGRNATIFACNNDGEGTGKFDLTTADIFTGTVTKKYYPTLADLNADTNEITNPTAYISAEKIIYAKIISAFGCTATVTIQLSFHPVVTLRDVLVEECYIENDITHAMFDLTKVNVGGVVGQISKFYKTLTDAQNETNPISAPATYLAESSEVYVRITSANQCYDIAKITLKVLPPVKSLVLKDKTICAEEKTTLDAGPGFDGYEWSTGDTTQSINNAGIGIYWVKLKTGKCFTLQTVTVFASKQPVISSVEISNNTITVNASGGIPPYKYSIDGVNWQDSNVFSGLPRGENKIFLKDSYDCTPIQITVTVPNLINAITPNGDKINDDIDYSALSYKKNLVFIVYDRYGNKLYEANKIRNYKWDGTASGKKLPTGTYWYTISWNENDKNSTETKYSGWILLKNKE